MSFCLHCGKQLPDDAKFCSECGCAKPVEKVCPKCGAKVTGKFCAECGTSIEEAPATWDCGCGKKGLTGKFCDECGAKKED